MSRLMEKEPRYLKSKSVVYQLIKNLPFFFLNRHPICILRKL